MGDVRLQDIRKRHDPISMRSGASIKTEVDKLITAVFVSALECIEIKFGKQFEGYDEMRAKILRIGNNAKRCFQEKIAPNYNFEKIPDETIVCSSQGLE